ncbi:MAG: hypothetical protein M1499_02705 [Firmicutes bacterium]|jgi:hypothetical protein|nr:hypothetical protein [Bacillota bacterium]
MQVSWISLFIADGEMLATIVGYHLPVAQGLLATLLSWSLFALSRGVQQISVPSKYYLAILGITIISGSILWLSTAIV